MNAVSIGSVLVALIAALSAYASQRAVTKASTRNTDVNSRVEMEKEAYERARTYDTETIRRQDEEIAELREEVKTLKAENETLRNRMRRLEEGMVRGLTLEDLENIRDRRTDLEDVPDQ